MSETEITAALERIYNSLTLPQGEADLAEILDHMLSMHTRIASALDTIAERLPTTRERFAAAALAGILANAETPFQMYAAEHAGYASQHAAALIAHLLEQIAAKPTPVPAPAEPTGGVSGRPATWLASVDMSPPEHGLHFWRDLTLPETVVISPSHPNRPVKLRRAEVIDAINRSFPGEPHAPASALREAAELAVQRHSEWRSGQRDTPEDMDAAIDRLRAALQAERGKVQA